jgi:catechol 2,3-dioxygenase-like lactoylglutathione lyase family enzyme
MGGKVTGMATVGVPVSDHERALAFYAGTLGFEKTRDATFGPGLRWVEVTPPGSATSIALTPAGTTSPGVDTGIRLLTDDADAFHEDLRAAGVDADPQVLRFGDGVPPMFSFRDPDGNTLYVIQQS